MKYTIFLLILSCGLSGALFGEEPPLLMDSSCAPCYYAEPSYCENAMPFCAINSDPYMSTCNQTMGQCLWSSLRQNFGFEASALYWRTGRDDRLYAFTQTVSGTNQDNFFSVVKPEAKWGWRVRASYAMECCAFADIEYAQFRESTHNTTVAPLDVATLGYFATSTQMSLNVTNKYNRARARLGWFICNGARGSFYTTGGASWIRLWEKDQLTNTPSGSLAQKSWFNAAGLEAGVGGTFRFLKCLGLKAEINGVGAIGKRHNNFNFVTGGEASATLTSHYPTVTHVLPGLETCLEAFFTTCWCFPMTVAFGYEYHHFFKALIMNKVFGTGGLDKAFLPQDELDLGFGGFYLTFRVNY